MGLRWGVRCHAWATVRCPWGDVCNAVMARRGACQVNGGGCPDIVCRNPTSTRAVTDSGRQIHRPESESTGNRKRRNTVQLARVSFLCGVPVPTGFFFFRTLFFLAPVKTELFYTGQFPDVPMAPLFFRWFQAPPESKVQTTENPVVVVFNLCKLFPRARGE